MPSSRFLSRALTATLLVASTCVSAAVPLDDALTRATLLVRKSFAAPATQEYLVEGRDFDVVYTVCNVGNGPAFDVELVDSWANTSFTIVSEEATLQWAQIDAGANVTSKMTLRPTTSGPMVSARAKVSYTYRLPEGAAVDAEYAEEDGSVRVNAVSSTPGRIEIVTVPVFERLTVDKQAYYTMVSVLALTLIVVSYRQWFAALSANKPVSAKRR